MWKLLTLAGVTAALVIPAGASGVELTKGLGQGCPDGQQGTFAFVVNQLTTTEPGTVTASFDSGESGTVGAFTVNKKTQEFFFNARGKLLSASTSLNGNLILDRFWCFPPA
jgi:hypothetical protein